MLRKIFCIVVLSLSALAVSAGDISSEQMSVGFNGFYRTGSWTPLWVEVSEGKSPVYASVQDPDGQWVVSSPAEIKKKDDRYIARFCVRFGRPNGQVLIHHDLDLKNATSVSLTPPAPSTDQVILVIGNPIGIERAGRLLADEDGIRPRIVLSSQGSLPLAEDPRDLDGADIILACANKLKQCDVRTLRSIDAWVRRGGRLVFLAGASAADISSEKSVLGKWLPGSVKNMVPLRRTAPLEVFSRCSRPMDRSLRSSLLVPMFEKTQPLDGVIEAHDGANPADLPLVVRRGYGLGVITWMSVDLDEPVFRSWPGSETMLVQLLGGAPGAKAGRAGEKSRFALDLSGQLRRAVDQFPGITPVPFSLVALLGSITIILLYPGSWLFARQASLGVSWGLLPLLSLLLGAAIWQIGSFWRAEGSGESVASVVDINTMDNTVRGFSWAGIWSNDNDEMDVQPKPHECMESETSLTVGWYADAGRGLGATDAPVPHPSLAARQYRYGLSDSLLLEVPIAASSSRLFESEWNATCRDEIISTTLRVESQGTLRGELVHHLPFSLKNCVLVYSGWLYEIGTLKAGDIFDPSSGRGPRSLISALTRHSEENSRDVVKRWKTDSANIAEILTIAGFHHAAGGSGFTSLESGRLGRIDLSSQLEVGRAVLAGFGPSGTDWSFSSVRDRKPSSKGVTMWRMLIQLSNGE
jgi:hypothetical protein